MNEVRVLELFQKLDEMGYPELDGVVGMTAQLGFIRQNLNQMVSSPLDRLFEQAPNVTTTMRHPSAKLELAENLYEQGAQFFLPVYLDSKIPAWKSGQKPVRFDTIKNFSYLQEKKGDRKGITEPRRLYDLALRTGTWHLPSRDRQKNLVVLDVDDWSKVTSKMRAVLESHSTFTVRTGRGAHFYFWVSNRYSHTIVSKGLEWLGRGRIVVLTGSDRAVAVNVTIHHLEDQEAKILYYGVKDSGDKPPPVERWKPSTMEHVEEEFQAFEGERNHKINGTLYRYRHLDDDKLTEMALDLAARCTPPYPPQEALSVVASIKRNRHRFPLEKSGNSQGNNSDSWTGDTSYVRLGGFLKNHPEPFTVREYEEHLVNLGWEWGKNGQVAAARKDVAKLFKLGALHKVGSIKSTGGRAADLYEPTRPWIFPPDHLPLKPTARNLKIARMASLLPDEPKEVVRLTMATALGGVSIRTVNRYAKFLAEDLTWGSPMVNRTIKRPFIEWSEAQTNTEGEGVVWGNSIRFRPSVYERTRGYELLMQGAALPLGEEGGGRFSSIKPQLSLIEHNKSATPVGERVGIWEETETCLNGTVWQESPFEEVKNPLERPEIKPNKPCLACGEDTNAEKFCSECTEKIAQIRLFRKTYPPKYGKLKKPMEDFCEFTHQFFWTDELPLRAVHPSEEATYRLLKEFSGRNHPIEMWYCPNPKCSHKIHSAFYMNDFALPTRCPYCQETITIWVKRPNLPEEQLIGYPINRYNRNWEALFDVMDKYWNERENGQKGELIYPGFKFEGMFKSEILEAWRQYREEITITHEVNCQTCGEVFSIRALPDQPKPTLKRCSACMQKYIQDYTLPPDVEERLTGKPELQTADLVRHLEAFYKNLFDEKPRYDTDIIKLVKKYKADWIELAFLVTKRRGKVVRKKYPYIRGILDNWKIQGHINRADQEHESLYRLEIKNENLINEAELVLVLKDPYIAYEKHIKRLDREQAIAIQQAVFRVGEENVIYAISEAVRCDVRRWDYCEAIIERFTRETPHQPLLMDLKRMNPREQFNYLQRLLGLDDDND